MIYTMNAPSPKRQRDLRHSMNRAINKWAERVEKSIALFDSVELLNELNAITFATMFSEQAHMDAPDAFSKKFRHIRNLIVKRPLHGPVAGRMLKSEVLFEHVDKLFLEMGMDLMARAHFQANAQPEKKNSIEAWFLSRSRDLLEPPLGGARQFRQLFIDRFSKFDKSFTSKMLGLSCDECLQLIDAMDILFTQRLKRCGELGELAVREASPFHEKFRSGEMTFEQAVSAARSCQSVQESLDARRRVFFTTLSEVVSHSGLPREGVTQFFERTSVVPGQANSGYLLPTDKEHGRLFLKLEDETFYILDASAVYPDLYHLTEGLVDGLDSKTSSKYYRWRGVVTPMNVARTLAGIFGKDNIFENLYYPLPDGAGLDAKGRWGEADILIRHGREVLLCEVKAHELNRSMSDRVGPERMRRDFETIQEGYGQCVRTHRYILERSPAQFFREDHRTLMLSLDEPAGEICYLIVTANSFGCLAGNCSDLLKRDETPLPVVMSEFDLVAVASHMSSPDMFLKYLRQRASLQGFLKTSDELEVAGVFVTQGSLDELIALKEKGEADMLILSPDTSFVFNGPAWERTSDVQDAIKDKRLFSTLISADTLGLVKVKP